MKHLKSRNNTKINKTNPLNKSWLLNAELSLLSPVPKKNDIRRRNRNVSNRASSNALIHYLDKIKDPMKDSTKKREIFMAYWSQ